MGDLDCTHRYAESCRAQPRGIARGEEPQLYRSNPLPLTIVLRLICDVGLANLQLLRL